MTHHAAAPLAMPAVLVVRCAPAGRGCRPYLCQVGCTAPGFVALPKRGRRGGSCRAVGGGRLRVGDEAAGTVGAGVLALDPAAEGEEAEPPHALHVGGHHRAAAVRAAPRRLLRPQHLLLLAAHQHQTHLRRSRLRLLPPPPATKTPLELSWL
ncbi:hypothetical protein GW17_00051546 [Ensete ventricosum]|nr:hypothetical protein GW17_00051546 [Ensete ventricosum]